MTFSPPAKRLVPDVPSEPAALHPQSQTPNPKPLSLYISLPLSITPAHSPPLYFAHTHTHTLAHTLSLTHTLSHTLSLSHTHSLSLSQAGTRRGVRGDAARSPVLIQHRPGPLLTVLYPLPTVLYPLPAVLWSASDCLISLPAVLWSASDCLIDCLIRAEFARQTRRQRQRRCGPRPQPAPPRSSSLLYYSRA